MTRPRAIVLFERLYLLTLILAAGRLGASGMEATHGHEMDSSIVFQVATLALTLVLILLVSRRRSRVAGFILAAAFLVGLPIALGAISSAALAPTGWFLGAQLLLQGVALAMLLRPDGREWFRQVIAPSADQRNVD